MADSPASDWANPLESAPVGAMTTRADDYLHKAEQFEALAQSSKAETAKAVYEHLAWSYRQLGIHAGRTSKKDIDLDELAERMVGRKAP